MRVYFPFEIEEFSRMIVTMSGATFVRADRETVWAALHDINVLAPCIPGCRSLVRVSEHTFALVQGVRLGPVTLTFEGKVNIARSDPLRGYCLIGQGSGGRAGSAAGRARIVLTQEERGCRLSYTVEAEAHGPLSNAGSYVLTSVGTTIAKYFARRFSELVGRSHTGGLAHAHGRI